MSDKFCSEQNNKLNGKMKKDGLLSNAEASDTVILSSHSDQSR